MANINNKVTGSLWRGRSWKEAIKLSIEHPDCGVEKVMKEKNPHLIFCEEKILSHWQLWGYGNGCKKYVTKIPAILNEAINKTIEENDK